MDFAQLYQFVLMVVLIGMVLGVGLIVLGNFSVSTGVGATASTAINNTITALATIPSTWLPLIVTISALAIILTLVIRSFYFQGKGR